MTVDEEVAEIVNQLGKIGWVRIPTQSRNNEQIYRFQKRIGVGLSARHLFVMKIFKDREIAECPNSLIYGLREILCMCKDDASFVKHWERENQWQKASPSL